jgi:hypothetical protein
MATPDTPDTPRVLSAEQPVATVERLPERIPVKLTESAHRLWMAINGHDINDFYKRAEFILKTSLDGLRIWPDNRATVKALLVEHFEQITKSALAEQPRSDPAQGLPDVNEVAEAIRLRSIERGHPVHPLVAQHLAAAAIEAIGTPAQRTRVYVCRNPKCLTNWDTDPGACPACNAGWPCTGYEVRQTSPTPSTERSIPDTEEDAAEEMDNGRNTGGKSYYRPQIPQTE